jgi:hypothetical protein
MSFDRRIYRHPDGTEGMLWESSYSCKGDMQWVFHSPKHNWIDLWSWKTCEQYALDAGYVFVEEIPKKARSCNYDDHPW